MPSNQESVLESYFDKRVLYCFLDEAGNFDFSPSGTPYYLYTALVADDPFPLNRGMLEAKYTLLCSNKLFSASHSSNDFFHAAEDTPLTRRLAYRTLQEHVGEFRVYTVVVQKNKVPPLLREQKTFFSMVMRNLLEDVMKRENVVGRYDHLGILTDRIPVQRKSAAIIGSIKSSLKSSLGDAVTYSLSSMDSKSDFGLQAADYCSWAIYRAWTNDDVQFRNLILPSIKYERDFFEDAGAIYY